MRPVRPSRALLPGLRVGLHVASIALSSSCRLGADSRALRPGNVMTAMEVLS
ncbi:MAG: hypothetical protein QG597_3860 [Actinomycetota bacterium]|nr:hypothetical protein [Actinomycetota bacterium]